MERIFVFDTTLRDGEQVPGACLNPREKLEIAMQLSRLQVDAIEAGFPISSPGDFKAVKMIADKVKGPTIVALARAVREDIETAWKAIQGAEKPRIHVFLGTSDVHIQKKFGLDRQKALERGLDALRFAKSLCPEVEYSTEDASRSDPDYLASVVEQVIAAGATVVNIPDTVGYAVPEQFGALIALLINKVPNIDKIILSVHCHNDLGLATANTLAAVRNGARQVECTMNGLGERAGNASLEEVVMAIRTRKDYFDFYSSVNTREIMRTSILVSRLMGMPVQANKAIVGANAFAHSSGIHQDGILKDRATYEIIRPEDLGITDHAMVLTARSGRHALKDKTVQMGYDLQDREFEQVYERFLSVADKKKQVYDQDVDLIVQEVIFADLADSSLYALESYKIITGNGEAPEAKVRLRKNEVVLEAVSEGGGPIDAIFKAIDKIVGAFHKLEDFQVQAVTETKEAMGIATVWVSREGFRALGRGASTDILKASARAYVEAINRIGCLVAGKVERPGPKKQNGATESKGQSACVQA
ncbi:MAG: 2-isopropylmalate synthase [Deltaproteobacteria bacterium]|nr:2-isopropylmalate synthase [Deltaproteobacteria bacterium]